MSKRKPMTVVYVAGAYRGTVPYETEQNIRRAEATGTETAALAARRARARDPQMRIEEMTT